MGIEKGRHTEKLLIARNLLKAGITLSVVIAEFTGLSIKEIKKLMVSP